MNTLLAYGNNLLNLALCFKLFGVSEFSLIIPNIISGVILIYIGYRTGKWLVGLLVYFGWFVLKLLQKKL